MVRAEAVYVDTHVLVGLWLGHVKKFGREARRALDSHEVLAPAAAVLELEILHEIGRLQPTAAQVMAVLGADIGLRVCDLSFRTVVEYALSEGWTRDPFDR